MHLGLIQGGAYPAVRVEHPLAVLGGEDDHTGLRGQPVFLVLVLGLLRFGPLGALILRQLRRGSGVERDLRRPARSRQDPTEHIPQRSPHGAGQSNPPCLPAHPASRPAACLRMARKAARPRPWLLVEPSRDSEAVGRGSPVSAWPHGLRARRCWRVRGVVVRARPGRSRSRSPSRCPMTPSWRTPSAGLGAGRCHPGTVLSRARGSSRSAARALRRLRDHPRAPGTARTRRASCALRAPGFTLHSFRPRIQEAFKGGCAVGLRDQGRPTRIAH